jgi:hypothetical protein
MVLFVFFYVVMNNLPFIQALRSGQTGKETEKQIVITY